MTYSTLPAECPDSIGFRRLHALIGRGYRPRFGVARGDDGHVCIALKHPREGRRDNPPAALTLWSDGIISTNDLLWPTKYVASGDPAPDWQRFIFAEDEKRFSSFLDSVQPPNAVDLYLKPLWAQTKLFSVRLIFGSTLCALIGFAGKLVLAEV